jgi:hypothetical protein
MLCICCIFLENSPFIHDFKHQISALVITINRETLAESMHTSLTNIYNDIFTLLTKLKYLDLDFSNMYPFRRSLLSGLPSTTCSSSSIVHLRIKMHNFDDCLCLLDGRLSQLHTFIVNLDYIYDFLTTRPPSPYIIHNLLKIINNSVTLKQED